MTLSGALGTDCKINCRAYSYLAVNADIVIALTAEILDVFGFEDFSAQDSDKKAKQKIYNGLSQFLHNSIQEETICNILDYFRAFFDVNENIIPSNKKMQVTLMTEAQVRSNCFYFSSLMTLKYDSSIRGLFGILKDTTYKLRTAKPNTIPGTRIPIINYSHFADHPNDLLSIIGNAVQGTRVDIVIADTLLEINHFDLMKRHV